MRAAITDPLQSAHFWLMDVAPVTVGAVPVFSPLMGFSSATSPEIEVEVQEINEGNAIFNKRTVAKNASVSNISLQRAATFHDDEFYRWVVAAVGGTSFLPGKLGFGAGSPRRNLLLVHFFPRPPLGAGSAMVSLSPAPFDLVARIPARVFLLQGCLPIRYKAGSDFDATSAEISIMELDIAVEGVQQINLTG